MCITSGFARRNTHGNLQSALRIEIEQVPLNVMRRVIHANALSDLLERLQIQRGGRGSLGDNDSTSAHAAS